MKDFKNAVSITYKSLYDDYNTVNIKELLNGIPTANAIEIISYFHGQIHTQERDQLLQAEFAQVWSGRFPSQDREKISSFIKKYSYGSKEFNLINNYSGLLLLEAILENSNDLPPADNLTPEQELNLFKAYLICSQRWTDKQEKCLTGEKIQLVEQLVQLMIPIQLPLIDLIEFKDFRLQFIKAIYFFRFCETNEVFKGYLDLFLKDYGIDSWQEYLKNVISGYLRNLNPPHIPTMLNVGSEFGEFKSWLDQYCVKPQDFKSQSDFIFLRSFPVYRYSESKFVFMNFNFFVDKLYQGIQFDFSRALINQKAQYNNKSIKNFPAFKGIYGDIYSESGLFYQVMDYVFVTQKKYTRFSGEQMKKFLGDGEPDYYIRDKGKIYLFEYKDALFSAEAKHSFDYQVIIDELLKKLVQNSEGKPKGVKQLVSSIEKIGQGEFDQFDQYDKSKCIIYPIIVYTDDSYNTPGINFILNKKFRELIREKRLESMFEIKKLTLIHIDTLIKFQDLIRNKKISINHLLNNYYKYIQSSNMFQKVTTFNQFTHYATENIQYETPKMLMEEAIKLIEE